MNMSMAMIMIVGMIVSMVVAVAVIMIMVVLVGRRIRHCSRLGTRGYYTLASRRLFLCPAIQSVERRRRLLLSAE